MHFTRLAVKNFGLFGHRDFSIRPHGLTLVYGENETGKSTLLAFVRSMMFEPAKKDVAPYLPEHSSEFGGTVNLVDAQGKPLTITRRFGGKGAKKTDIFYDGRSVDAARLEALFGGASKELFRNVYAFSLSELTQLDSLQSDDVTTVLYGASIGAGIAGLVRASAQLEKWKKDIFLPTGTNPRLNQKLKELPNIKDKIKQAQNSVAHYERLNTEIQELEVEVARLNEQLEHECEGCQNLETRIKYFPDWQRLWDLRQKLSNSGLPSDFDPKEVDKCRELTGRIAEIERRQRELVQELQEYELAQSNLDRQPALLQHADRIRILTRESGEAKKFSAERQRLESTIAVLAAKLASSIELLGSGWDISRAKRVLESSPDTQTIMDYERRSATLDATSSQNSTQLLQLDKDHSDLERKIDIQKQKLADCEFDEHHVLPAQVLHARNGLEKYKSDILALKERESELENLKNLILPKLEIIMPRVCGPSKETLLHMQEAILQRKAFDRSFHFQKFSNEPLQQFANRRASENAKLRANEAELARIEDELFRKQEKGADLQTKLGALSSVDLVAFPNAEEVIVLNTKLQASIHAAGQYRRELDSCISSLSALLGRQCDSDLANDIADFDIEKFRASLEELDREIGRLNQSVVETQASLASQNTALKEHVTSLSLIPIVKDSEPELLARIHATRNSIANAKDLSKQQQLVENARSSLSALNARLEGLERDASANEGESATSGSVLGIIFAIIFVLGLAITYLLFAQYGMMPAALSGGATLAVSGFGVHLSRKNSNSQERRAQRAEELSNSITQLRKQIDSEKLSLEGAVAAAAELQTKVGIEAMTADKIEQFIHECEKAIEADQAALGHAKNRSALDAKMVPLRNTIEQLRQQLVNQNSELEGLTQQRQSLCNPGWMHFSGSAAHIIDRARKLHGLASTVRSLTSKLDAASADCSRLAVVIHSLVPALKLQDSNFTSFHKNTAEWLALYSAGRTQEQETVALDATAKQNASQILEVQANIEKKNETLRETRLALEGIESDWQQFLNDLDLVPDTTQDSAVSLFEVMADLANSTTQYVRELGEYEKRLQSLATYRTNVCAIPQLSLLSSADHEGLSTAVENLLRAIDESEAKRAVRMTVNQELSALQDQLAKVQTSRTELHNTNQTLSAEKMKLTSEWREWLLSHHLDSALMFKESLSFLENLQSIVKRSNEISDHEHQLKQASSTVENFESSLFALCQQLKLPAPHKESIDRLVQELQSSLAKAEAAEAKFRDLETKKSTKQKSLQSDATELDSLRKKIGPIFEKYGCANVEELLSLTKKYTESGKTTVAIQGLLATLTKELKVAEEELSDLFDQFDLEQAKRSLQSIKHKITQLQAQLGTAGESDEHESLMFKVARKKTELEALVNSRQLNALRLEEQALLAEISQMAKEWIKYTLAESLLERAKRRFENEAQPQVISMASSIFSRITNGKYLRIQGDAGSKSLDAITKEHKPVASSVLSTGAREQLYLALRFAFIQHRAASCEPLPVIMDDILVNFDHHRALNAIQAIKDLAETHQVLFFSCHPSTVAYFQQVVPEAEVLNLSKTPIEQVVSSYLNELRSGVVVNNRSANVPAVVLADKDAVIPATGATPLTARSVEIPHHASQDRSSGVAAYRTSSGASGRPNVSTKLEYRASNDKGNEAPENTAALNSGSALSASSGAAGQFIAPEMLEFALQTFRRIILSNISKDATLLKNLCNEALHLVRRSEHKFMSEEKFFLQLRDSINERKLTAARQRLEESLEDEPEDIPEFCSQDASPSECLLQLAQRLSAHDDYLSATIVWRAAQQAQQFVPCAESTKVLITCGTAVALSRTGRPWSEVQPIFKAAAKAADKVDDDEARLSVYLDCADCAWENNAYGMALEHKKKALEIVRKTRGDSSTQAVELMDDIRTIANMLGVQN